MAVKKYAVPKAPGNRAQSDQATFHEKLATARARARAVASKAKRPVAIYRYDRDVGRYVKHDVVAARIANPRKIPRNRWINAKAVRVRRVKGRDVIDLKTR